jgi:hypothetical protein
MPVSWQEHSIDFHLTSASSSAIAWLQNNIVSMRRLRLVIDFPQPKELLLDLMKVGR